MLLPFRVPPTRCAADVMHQYCFLRPFVAGVDSFCRLSLRRPTRTYGAHPRPAPAATPIRAAQDNIGESPMFESVGDLEGKVLHLNAL